MNPTILAAPPPPGAWAGNPVTTVLMLSLLALAPFLLMMTTSFVKFAVVFSILRNALGTQQIPPTPVILGLAVIMTVYVMAPIGAQVYDALQPMLTQSVPQDVISPAGAQMILNVFDQVKEPLRAFLKKHAHPKERALFYQMAVRMGPPQWKETMKDDDLLVLIPAFTVSELAEAFMIGFLIFLPFLVIDMVVSNILLAMGMHMLSPVTVSLPFKLLLFIMVDGWDLLVRGLIQGYVG
ncbi:MAG: type III secretion system export apparatus subunit SctR [Acidobacteria bacterium]|nr:type III secretion system export apparatus subunit SctR [Acidobacteriota bacterium]MDW7984559.1 type III secretion system export apparatus subunit SctR [Acidobacteriota bacterium]